MKIQSRLIGHCTDKVTTQDLIQIDANALVQRLILFDTFILKSVRLRDIPSLLAIFGYEGLINLLKSGSLQIECGHMTSGDTSSLRLHQGNTLPLELFSFSIVSPGDYKQFISRCFADIEIDTKLTKKAFIKLKEAVAENILLPPKTGGNESMVQLYKEIENNSQIFLALVARTLSQRLGSVVVPAEFQLKMHRIDDNTFRSESNIFDKFHVQPVETHKIIQSAALALGSLNIRFEEMKLYQALSGFTEDEVSIFDDKMRFLIESIMPGKLEQQMNRVCEIQGFPTLSGSENVKVNAEKLIDIRNSKECREFREWLQSLDGVSDKEIHERLTSLRSKIGNLLNGTSSKVIRFIIPALVGVVPGIGTLASLALDSLDSFLLERVFPSDGPVSFISDLYPSIFEQNN